MSAPVFPHFLSNQTNGITLILMLFYDILSFEPGDCLDVVTVSHSQISLYCFKLRMEKMINVNTI